MQVKVLLKIGGKIGGRSDKLATVRRATLGMYPQGEAARSNKPPLIDLDELPAFEAVCAATGGYGERVEDPAALPAAIERAVRAVTAEKRQALLNVIYRGP